MLQDVRAQEAWIVSVDRTAHLKQCIVLAEALGLSVTGTIKVPGTTATDPKVLKYVDVAKAIMLCIFAFVMHGIPRNKIVFCSGRSISLLVWLWKKCAGQSILSIYIGHAKSPLVFYDVMIIPEHDIPLMQARRLPPQHVRIVPSTGVLAKQQAPGQEKNSDDVLVCIGGNNITFFYEGPGFEKFLAQLTVISKIRNLRIALSGRTTDGIRHAIERHASLASGIIEAHNREQFEQFQNQAASVFVCPDSVTMISEALAKGATVYVPRLDVLKYNTSDEMFVRACRQKGYVLDVEDFPANAQPSKYPNSLAQVIPSVLDALHRWSRHSI